ncbi:hypothetical protein G6678_05765 [Polynucleobacter paneuropaeus]|nr:hypothetical protein G6703_05710 [Polynucleobacter paneuropaeus]QWD32961.1 hypothetical protein G6678_05765 [Polynucleobacter paneuropaeus]
MSLKDLPQDAVNCWIGYEDYFYKSPLARNWTAFHLDYFNYLSNKLGLKNPISHRDDLLFNFPLLDGPSPINKKFDFLIVNSMPLSGQIAGFDPNFLNVLIKTLVFKGYSVISTHPNGIVESTMERGFNLLDIARISNYSKVIIGVPNGPMWLTFNIFNNDNLVLRLPWVSIQDLNLGKNCKTCYESLEIYNLLQLNKII